MKLTGIFMGRVQILYRWGCYGRTRGNGKTWHGGVDLVGLDGNTIYMPYYRYKDADGNWQEKKISGTVTRARIVWDHTNKTWEWGYYICVQLDSNQTPDTVNYLYFCHCKELLVKAGAKVTSGDKLAIMGMTGNAATASPAYAHCHFEARATATGSGVNPCAYAGCDNAVGVYENQSVEPLKRMVTQPMSAGDLQRMEERAVEIGVQYSVESA